MFNIHPNTVRFYEEIVFLPQITRKEINLKNNIGRVLEDGIIRQHHEIYLSAQRRVKKVN